MKPIQFAIILEFLLKSWKPFDEVWFNRNHFFKARRDVEDKKKEEEERARELAELERLKIEASQPAVDAATLFSLVRNIIFGKYQKLGTFRHS